MDQVATPCEEPMMGSSQLTLQQIVQISGFVSQYITAQRDKFLGRCVPLTREQRVAMDGFFSSHLLDGVRVIKLDGFRVANPSFYPMLVEMGFTNLPDFSQMAAITFSDVVVSHVPFTNGLLFHELVHVEQYRQLGIPRFSELYVDGFHTGGGYDGIPLEVHAYALGSRFEANPRQRFLVADEVANCIRECRY
ncbi:MAG TPA: hypothetical protein VFC37_18585 [Terracidiphilus sp.]|nr:hypothetical protein [Terracidiphilus sp.]